MHLVQRTLLVQTAQPVKPALVQVDDASSMRRLDSRLLGASSGVVMVPADAHCISWAATNRHTAKLASLAAVIMLDGQTGSWMPFVLRGSAGQQTAEWQDTIVHHMNKHGCACGERTVAAEIVSRKGLIPQQKGMQCSGELKHACVPHNEVNTALEGQDTTTTVAVVCVNLTRGNGE
jgi:hypothetical protein